MKRLTRITLITNDTIYAGAFTEAVAATQSGFTVSVVTPAQDVVQTITSGAQSVTCGAQSIASGAQSVRAGVRLVDESGRDGNGQDAVLTVSVVGAAEPFCVVDKYAGCGEICSKAVIAYSEFTACTGSTQRVAAGHSAEIISVMGIDGGAGTSSVALGLAGELSAYHDKKTMYLSFETFESPRLGLGARMSIGATGLMVDTGGGSGVRAGGPVSDYLFDFLRSGERNGAQEISVEPYLSRDDYGTVRFVPSTGFNRLRELSGDTLERFIGTVTGEIRPDILIIDWGSCLCADTAEWLAGSSFAVFVGRHGGTKSYAGEGYKADAEASGIVGASNTTEASGVSGASGIAGASGVSGIAAELGVDEKKALFVVNRRPPETDVELPQRFIGISEDPYAFESDEGRVAISLATAFGTGVKKLADIVLGVSDEAGAPDVYINTENERGRKIDELFAA